MTVIPETRRNADWDRKVARGVRQNDLAIAALQNNTGWEYHLESPGTQALTAATRTQITISPTLSVTGQSPDGLTMFDSNEIFGNLNDVILTRFTADFTPSDATASNAIIEVEADVLGVIDKIDYPILSGAGVSERITWNPLIFIGSADVAAGVRLFITVDGPGSLVDKAVLPVRIHEGR